MKGRKLFASMMAMAMVFLVFGSTRVSAIDLFSKFGSLSVNNVRLSGSNLSEDERALLDRVEEIAEQAEFHNYSREIVARNTAETTLRSASFTLLCYDHSGRIVAEVLIPVGNWKPDRSFVYDLTDAYMPANPHHIEIFAEYVNGGNTYRTLSHTLREAEDTETGVHVGFKYTLPCTLTVVDIDGEEEVFSVTDFSFHSAGETKNYFVAHITKESGPDCSLASFEWSVVKDGDDISASGEGRLDYINVGETILIRPYDFVLEPGNYSFVIDQP